MTLLGFALGFCVGKTKCAICAVGFTLSDNGLQIGDGAAFSINIE